MSFLLTQGVLQQQANRAGGKQYALEFTKSDGNYVDIPYTINLFDGSNDFSIEAVAMCYREMRPDSNSNSECVINFANNLFVSINFNEPSTVTGASDNKLGFWIFDGNHNWVGTSYTKNEIYHIVGRYEASTNKMSLYVDSVFIGEKTINNPDYKYSDGNNRIGMHNKESKHFDGQISKIRVYDKLLSENEIESLNRYGSLNNEFIKYNFIGEGNVLPEEINDNNGTIYGANWIEL